MKGKRPDLRCRTAKESDLDPQSVDEFYRDFATIIQEAYFLE